MTSSQYTVITLEHPDTGERLNIGVVAWSVTRTSDGVSELTEPHAMFWYFRRDWNRLAPLMTHQAAEAWKTHCRDMELTWSLPRLLKAIKEDAPGPYTWMRFRQPHASVGAPSIVMGIAASSFLKQ
jgi:hypothetical protein